MNKINKIKRYILMFLGTASLIVGVAGIILPLIPTTPLLLLAAICYGKSSDKLYRWLLNTKFLGSYIRAYQEGKGIPLKAKVTSVMILWLTAGYSIFYLVPLILVKFILLLVVIYISYFILSRKTAEREKRVES
ncbi:MAG TPA: YbaN family protein [Bacillus sp. (in: firmicutes)]|nr:YbaN family protein [Bacillus sp. (in: firmicutes)]